MFQQQLGHTDTGPHFNVSSERPEKWVIDIVTPGLVVQRRSCVNHATIIQIY